VSAITLRPEQLAAFERVAREDYETRVIEHLRENLSEPCAEFTDEALRTKIRTAQARAEKYGLESETEVLLYIESAMLFGDECFDEHPSLADVRKVLNDAEMSEEEKAERVRNRAELFDRAYRRGN
jgi:hypothetical protein